MGEGVGGDENGLPEVIIDPSSVGSGVGSGVGRGVGGGTNAAVGLGVGLLVGVSVGGGTNGAGGSRVGLLVGCDLGAFCDFVVGTDTSGVPPFLDFVDGPDTKELHKVGAYPGPEPFGPFLLLVEPTRPDVLFGALEPFGPLLLVAPLTP